MTEYSHREPLFHIAPDTGEIILPVPEAPARTANKTSVIGTESVRKLVEVENSSLMRAPRPVKDWVGAIDTIPDSDERYDAYHELGGQYVSQAPEQEIALRYQPWMRDVTVGVEQLGIFEMTKGAYTSLPEHDKRVYQLNVNDFTRRLFSNARTLGVRGQELSDDVLQAYGKRSHQDFIEYTHTLHLLAQYMHEKDIPGVHGVSLKHDKNRYLPETKVNEFRKLDKNQNGTPSIQFSHDGSSAIIVRTRHTSTSMRRAG